MQQSRSHGVTLVELLIVILILGIVALVTISSFSSNNPEKLELAVTEVVNAIRFARNEAIRTGTVHGVHVEASLQRLRVYQLKDVLGVLTPDYSVRNPVDKKLFYLVFDQSHTLKGTQLLSVTLNFVGLATESEYLEFDASGAPKYDNLGMTHMLETATLVITDSSRQQTVSVAPMTGRVTVY